MTDRPAGDWLVDWFSPDEYAAHRIEARLVEERTPFQSIELVRVAGYGRCLLLNGELQSAEVDEFIYHEALVHPALVAIEAPKRVLILGGGEGATLREVLRHRCVEQVTMVEIDARMVDVAREHLEPFHQGAFDDPRLDLVIGDGRDFVDAPGDAYDAILVDVNNPLEAGPSCRLFTREFYAALERRLAPGGAIIAQAGAATPLGLRCPATVLATVRTALAGARPFVVHVPSFKCEWTFVFGMRDPSEVADVDVDNRLAARGVTDLRFYDGPTHARIFALPRHLRRGLDGPHAISTDADPLVESWPGYTPGA